jgi:transcriptional regulator GlxA family with amidase domain
MSISSGIQELVQSGSLHQKRATCPTAMFSTLQHRFPETNWQETAWVRQDKIWSSRSAVTGLDMIAAWMREYFWDRSAALECALSTAGIAPLDDY